MTTSRLYLVSPTRPPLRFEGGRHERAAPRRSDAGGKARREVKPMDGPIQIVHLHKIESADRYLYHYTTADTAIKYILESGTLRMSPFTTVNDPWEAKHWFAEAVLNSGEDRTALDFMVRTASPALKGESKLLCFTRDAPAAAIDPSSPTDLDFGTV